MSKSARSVCIALFALSSCNSNNQDHKYFEEPPLPISLQLKRAEPVPYHKKNIVCTIIYSNEDIVQERILKGMRDGPKPAEKQSPVRVKTLHKIDESTCNKPSRQEDTYLEYIGVLFLNDEPYRLYWRIGSPLAATIGYCNLGVADETLVVTTCQKHAYI